jgi:hypothetical protein
MAASGVAGQLLCPPDMLHLERTAMPWLLALAAASGACASRQQSQPPQEAQLLRAISPPDRLGPPDYLPASARSVLRTLMPAHASDMGALMSAIMVLHYDEIDERARAIAADTRFARPMTGDASELNAALPDRFFLLQDELRTEAGILARAAAQASALDVADAYGRLSGTCVKCHAAYRGGPPPATASGPIGK